MKQVYAPANSAEAHMLAHLLEQNGIVAHIHGEALQGAVGDLPASNLIQLLVADDQYEQARTLVLGWEQASVPASEDEQARHPRPRLWFALVTFLLGVGSGWLLNEAAERNAIPINDQEIHSDRNADGREDLAYYFRIGAPYAYKGQFDRNFDGEMDSTEFYESTGDLLRRESDDDFDGFTETVAHFRDGNPFRTDVDTNNNGVADIKIFFRNGIIEREEIQSRTGRLTRRNFYERSRLARSESDLDGDGFLETVRTYDVFGEVATAETRPAR